MVPELVLLVLVSALAGSAVGVFTGLVPGIHVNTAAAVMLALYPSMESAVSGAISPENVPVMISCCIMSASAVHSFLDFVPSVFIGAPDPDEALSVLPAHRLMMQGLGMTAVRAAAIGSAVGAAASILLAVPLQWLMLHGATGILDAMTLGMLAFTMAVIVLTSDRPAVTALLAAAAGVLGYAVMNWNIPSEGIAGKGTLLFPLLTGLFGMPPLLDETPEGRMPYQSDGGRDPVGPGPGLRGVITGCIAGWFPGITATAAASIESAFSSERDPARFISLTASIGTVTSVFAVVTLSVTGSGRSGTAMAVKEVIGDSLDGFCSEAFVLILFSVAIASAIGYVATIWAGKGMSAMVGRIPQQKLKNAMLALIAVLVVLLTGPFGLLVLAVSTALGTAPPALGVSRVCLSACLILPVLVPQALSLL